MTDRDPEGRPADAVDRGRDWNATARSLPEGHPVRGYLLSVGDLIEHRRSELGAQIAADPPAWAQQRLPAVPDPDTHSDARMVWERRAGIAAAYREYRGIPDTQVSLGEPPPPVQQFARAMWLDAVEQLDEDPETRHWSRRTDDELHQARGAWQRAVRDADEHGPRSVSEEMSGLYRLAAEIRDDAILLRADADHRPSGDPTTAEIVDQAERYRELAERYLADARVLETDHATRQEWWDRTAPLREADQAAAAELRRRGVADPEPGSPRSGADGGRAPDGRPQKSRDRRTGTEAAHPRGGTTAVAMPHPAGAHREVPNSDTFRTDIRPRTRAALRSVGDAAHLAAELSRPRIAPPGHGGIPEAATDPARGARDAVRALDDAGRRSRLSRARRDGLRAAQPEPRQPTHVHRTARFDADQRAVEAARRGHDINAPTHGLGSGSQQSGSDTGQDHSATDGYDWD